MKISRNRIEQYLNSHNVTVDERTLMTLTQCLLHKSPSAVKHELKSMILNYRDTGIFTINHALLNEQKQKVTTASTQEINTERCETPAQPIDNELNKNNINIYILLAFTFCFALWLQPWETPAEKISDEWSNCQSKYNNQCSYVGNKFKTNRFEMLISEKIHGEYGDNECNRSIYWDEC